MEQEKITINLCSLCENSIDRKTELLPATRFHALKGSRFVGSRGIKNLFVCPECDCMWHTWHDPYYDDNYWRCLGQNAVPVFAADSSLTRLVDWLATDYIRSWFGITKALGTLLIRRQADGLQPGMIAIIQLLEKLTPPDSAESAARLEILFHLLELVVERSIHGSLRPKGPRVKPPRRFREVDLKNAAQQFKKHEAVGVTCLPITRDVLRRLLWEQRYGYGAPDPSRAVIALSKPEPIIRFLQELPLTAVESGTLRGLYAKAAFSAAQKLHGRGRLPENDHAIWMPKASWDSFEKIVDPVNQLAAIYHRILLAINTSNIEERIARLQMEVMLTKNPIKLGARFTNQATRDLEKLALHLKNVENDHQQLSYNAIVEILKLNQTRICLYHSESK